MLRALTKHFGQMPDLDIEQQRALVTIKQPRSVDWKAVARLIQRANFTFAGAHIRARGSVVDADGMQWLECTGSRQRMPLQNPRPEVSGKTGEFVARIDKLEPDVQATLIDIR